MESARYVCRIAGSSEFKTVSNRLQYFRHSPSTAGMRRPGTRGGSITWETELCSLMATVVAPRSDRAHVAFPDRNNIFW